MENSARDASGGGRRARRDPRRRVARFGLSPELEALALQIAQLARLSRGMRADVAESAAAEIAGLVRAGIPPMEIPARLGPPREVASRLRRERIRSRSLVFRVLRGWKTALAATIAFVFLLYLGALVWFHTAKPKVIRNFSAELNARVSALPGERAAPIYLEALAKFPDQSEEMMNIGLSDVHPGDPAWPEMVEYLKSCQEPISMVRRAAAIPVLGMPLSDEVDPRWSLRSSARTGEASPPSENPVMISISLPQLGIMRQLARTLAGDALAAAEDHDGERAASDLGAILGLARHAGEQPFLICDLVEIAIVGLDASRTGLLLEKYPGLLNDSQLASLSDAFAKCRVGGDAIRFDGERVFLEDMVQRVYTDNGNGDGRVCAAGLRTWRSLVSSTGLPAGGSKLSAAEWVFGPVIAYTMASRKEFLAEYNRYMDAADALKLRPRYARASAGTLDSQVAGVKGDPWKSRKYQLLAALIPALGKAVESGEDIAEIRDGVQTAIALERYRLAEGTYPEALDGLVPRFLASVPIDRFDGKPMRYRLTAGKPVLYTEGADLDDDGGRPPAGKNGNDSARRWLGRDRAAQAPDGDHILWPRPPDVPDDAAAPN